jgi:hypothetical protein
LAGDKLIFKIDGTKEGSVCEQGFHRSSLSINVRQKTIFVPWNVKTVSGLYHLIGYTGERFALQ